MPDSSPFKYEKADDSAGFLLWKITTLWHRELTEVLQKFGITQTQYAILASLQTHLVEHSKIDKMTVSKAIRRLEKDGLVLREKSSQDNRAVNVRFTARGIELIQKAIVAIETVDEKFFSCLREKQLEIYKSLTLKVILNNGEFIIQRAMP